jgi:hypothetical protein
MSGVDFLCERNIVGEKNQQLLGTHLEAGTLQRVGWEAECETAHLLKHYSLVDIPFYWATETDCEGHLRQACSSARVDGSSD